MESQTLKKAEKPKLFDGQTSYSVSRQKEPITNFQRCSNRSPCPLPRRRSQAALFKQVTKTATAANTSGPRDGREGMSECLVEPPSTNFGSSFCDSYEEAQVLRRYWAKSNNRETSCAVKSQAGGDENMKGEDSDECVWDDDAEDDEQIKERLEEARLNTIKNNLEK
ncbi:hypothetical protein L209DRAFT_733159 [Thermothelomyces heterothallicus CBS 203.75]